MLVIDDRFKLVHICWTQSIEILVFCSTSEQNLFHASNFWSGPCVQQNHSLMPIAGTSLSPKFRGQSNRKTDTGVHFVCSGFLTFGQTALTAINSPDTDFLKWSNCNTVGHYSLVFQARYNQHGRSKSFRGKGEGIAIFLNILANVWLLLTIWGIVGPK
jgi:hypothetical protein